MDFIYLILHPFGLALLWIYNFCHSYALTLVIFTLAVKIILFPLSYKGKRSMMQMSAISAQSQQLQKQYGKDRERYNEELQKLYSKEGVNPMGGCLWSFLPLPILIGLYAIIRRPLYYIAGLTSDQITQIQETFEEMGGIISTNQTYVEIKLASLLNQQDYWDAAQNVLGDAGDKLFQMDFSFLGLNLADVPTWKFWTMDFTWGNIGLFLIPFVVIAVTLFSTWINMRTNRTSTASGNAKLDATNRQMMIMMPLMYLWFGFIMPAGMCVYMIANSVITVLQDLICSKLLKKKMAEEKAAREAREALEREEEKRLRAEKIAQRAKAEEEAKKHKGKRKPAPSSGKKKDPTNEAGRIGIRPYARGRSYDPDRYGGVTPYRDTDTVDEQAVEAARQAKGQTEELPEENVSLSESETETAESVELTAEAVQTDEGEEKEDVIGEDLPQEEEAPVDEEETEPHEKEE